MNHEDVVLLVSIVGTVVQSIMAYKVACLKYEQHRSERRNRTRRK